MCPGPSIAPTYFICGVVFHGFISTPLLQKKKGKSISCDDVDNDNSVLPKLWHSCGKNSFLVHKARSIKKWEQITAARFQNLMENLLRTCGGCYSNRLMSIGLERNVQLSLMGVIFMCTFCQVVYIQSYIKTHIMYLHYSFSHHY